MENLEMTIERIRRMEMLFDEVLEAVSQGISECENVSLIRCKIKILAEYYESGLWLSDFECDERGELPSDLKRGVLSEDGLYNLLDDVFRNSDNIGKTEETEDIV